MKVTVALIFDFRISRPVDCPRFFFFFFFFFFSEILILKLVWIHSIAIRLA